MGSKLSCIYRPESDVIAADAAAAPAPARVIAADGSLMQLPASPSQAAVVSDVLGGCDGNAAAFFVCNSDTLYFDDHPPALLPGEPLRPGELYFVLPVAMLGRPLSSADMGRLAVRASAALAGEKPPQRQRHGGGGGKRERKKKKVRVMPAAQARGGDDGVDGVFNEKLNEQTLGVLAVVLSPARGGAVLSYTSASAAARCPVKKRTLSLVEEEP